MERFWLAMSMVVLGVAALAYVYLPPLWHESTRRHCALSLCNQLSMVLSSDGRWR